MMLLTVKTYPALVWSVCVLFAVESLSAPTPEADDINLTVDSVTEVYVEEELRPTTRAATPKPAEVGVAAATKNTVQPAVETPETNRSSDSTVGLVVKSTAAATPAVTTPAAAAATTAAAAAPATPAAATTAATPAAAAMPAATPAATPAVTTPAAAPAATTAARPAAAPAAPATTPAATATPAAAAATTAAAMPAATPAATPAAAPAAPPTSPDHRLLHSTIAATTAADEAQRTHSTTITETAHHAQDQFHQPSATTFTDKTAATSVAFVATVVASSPQPTSIVKPEITSQLPSTASSDESSKIFNQSLSSPSASTATAATTNTTSEAAPAFNPTSLPGATTEKSKTGTELPSTSQSVSATGISTDAAGSSSTATSISTPNSTATNSSAGILVPGKPKRLPVPTTEPTPATTATRQVSKSPSGTETQPCSNRGVVKQCLIVIAALAVLATIFMVSTIVLCTKLSARKYKVKKPQQATEMMCISSLLPETTYSYTRQRNPVRNGILVIPGGGDSDEELGDNLTLSSFLPDNDRYV